MITSHIPSLSNRIPKLERDPNEFSKPKQIPNYRDRTAAASVFIATRAPHLAVPKSGKIVTNRLLLIISALSIDFLHHTMGFKSMFLRKKKSSIARSSSSSFAAAEIFTRSPSTNAETQIEELRQVFQKFDINNDGKISSSELGAMISSLGQTATADEIQKMILEADKDGDGFISLEEFIEINIKDVDSDEVLESLRGAFSVFDIDGNGSISAEELHQVLKGLGEECSVAECTRMISGVDADGDGMISFEEFKVMMDNGLRFGRLDDHKH